MSDWWFNKLSQQKHHLFWQAHSRSAYFPDSFQDLINKMLCVDHEKRITIEAVRRHPWFTGPTLSAASIQAEMSRRSLQVNVEKQRERLEKERDRQRANRQDQAIGDDVYRSVDIEATLYSEPEIMCDASSDELPSSSPATVLFDLPQVAAPSSAPAPAPLMMNKDRPSMLDRLQSLNQLQLSDAAPQAPLLDSTQIALTQFQVACDPLTAVSNLQSALRSLRCDFTASNSWKFDVTFSGASKPVELTAGVFSMPPVDDQPSSVVISCKRLSGDATVFRNLYAALLMQLSA